MSISTLQRPLVSSLPDTVNSLNIEYCCVINVDTNVTIVLLFRHRQGMSSLEIELESFRDRYKVTSEELSSLNDDRVKLTEKVDDLKQQLHKLQQERNSSSRALSKQVQYSIYNCIY